MILSLYEKNYLNVGFVVAIILYLIYYLLQKHRSMEVSLITIIINLFCLFLFMYGSVIISNFILYNF